jgi:long-chain acyl-CoA synthetase
MTVDVLAPVRDREAAAAGSGDGAPDTFPKLVLEHARVRSGRPANREKDYGIWQSWIWAEVAAEVEALACGLAASGFRRGDKLAIIGDNRPRPATASRRRLCRERLTDPCRTDR